MTWRRGRGSCVGRQRSQLGRRGAGVMAPPVAAALKSTPCLEAVDSARGVRRCIARSVASRSSALPADQALAPDRLRQQRHQRRGEGRVVVARDHLEAERQQPEGGQQRGWPRDATWHAGWPRRSGASSLSHVVENERRGVNQLHGAATLPAPIVAGRRPRRSGTRARPARASRARAPCSASHGARPTVRRFRRQARRSSASVTRRWYGARNPGSAAGDVDTAITVRTRAGTGRAGGLVARSGAGPPPSASLATTAASRVRPSAAPARRRPT